MSCSCFPDRPQLSVRALHPLPLVEPDGCALTGALNSGKETRTVSQDAPSQNGGNIGQEVILQARCVTEKSLRLLVHASLKRRVQHERAHIWRLERDPLAAKTALVLLSSLCRR